MIVTTFAASAEFEAHSGHARARASTGSASQALAIDEANASFCSHTACRCFALLDLPSPPCCEKSLGRAVRLRTAKEQSARQKLHNSLCEAHRKRMGGHRESQW